MSDTARLPLADVLLRVRTEYREVPGLKLTPSQAIRLFQVEPSVCATILETLVKERFLSRTGNGLFIHVNTPG